MVILFLSRHVASLYWLVDCLVIRRADLSHISPSRERDSAARVLLRAISRACDLNSRRFIISPQKGVSSRFKVAGRLDCLHRPNPYLRVDSEASL
jgi:hypothetical protein